MARILRTKARPVKHFFEINPLDIPNRYFQSLSWLRPPPAPPAPA
ncbi:hypothetical protein SAMN04487960_10637 [Marinobacter mobilis]|uniref:Uncharacterized protein n=1 Tax=Marinobacter mobilis TaxID=488533 RepID=A0A1H2YR43_9GAMM|nr:hypothetical protein SAMN04487960_10637 [Marinobacter mobilis]